MENYTKGKNVEEPLERERIPIPDLPKDFLWMQVRGGSKIRNLLTHALEEFPKIKTVVWTGFGPSVGKAVSCAEIMKRELGNNLHQISKICYRLVEEYWDPKIPELDQMVVKRRLPMIHILLSDSPLNTEEFGYQAPGTIISYESLEDDKKSSHNQNTKTPTKEFSKLGMDSRKRQKRQRPFKKNTPQTTQK